MRGRLACTANIQTSVSPWSVRTKMLSPLSSACSGQCAGRGSNRRGQSVHGRGLLGRLLHLLETVLRTIETTSARLGGCGRRYAADQFRERINEGGKRLISSAVAVYDDVPVRLGFGQFAPMQPARGQMFSARTRAKLAGEPRPAVVEEAELYGVASPQ
jgi:hypothetical protein